MMAPESINVSPPSRMSEGTRMSGLIFCIALASPKTDIVFRVKGMW